MNPKDLSTKEDFITFLNTLRHDLTENAASWENQTLESFLEAMEAWLNDSNSVSNTPTWSTFATSLLAGKAYE
ncbi:hypothetical protein HZF08_12080 [Paenibacillus sp. CGMCC 1.16610]|uniref:DUF7660 domain-containing protein n=1 Tax=Paenibacillus anseongense TaxID=2682845 RepID=A0ABW9U861_9BACL|nr:MULTISPECIES: hypothetical protein [Paenibacillus]MBA2939049.1 hypothetical protein [Paenibacillus sp. CGMCC 1.16610]MVQ35008.1 hypothetical protein [Paenibacillus anseongense]